MGRTRLRETRGDLLPGDVLGSQLGAPALGAERASVQRQAHTLARGTPAALPSQLTRGLCCPLTSAFIHPLIINHRRAPPAPFDDRAATFPPGQSLDSISGSCPLQGEVKSLPRRVPRGSLYVILLLSKPGASTKGTFLRSP